uniref:Reverse transcriptase domain-containing protein n=1 Tax=Fagus sylvatica TaxID=28930 RepID=A0A2N9J6F4_FAGSY
MMRTKGRKTTKIPVKQNRKGIPTPTPLHQGRRRHRSQRGKTPSLDSKIDSLEEKIRLIQGLNSFGNTDFFEHVLVPQHDGATQVQGPGVREIQWERRPHDPSANLKKISHWKELADTFLAQYGFNSQIAPDRFDLQRMEKKSNETFREYAQRWREKAARARPPLDEREMIKIFVDTLKNPYFDRMMGLQMQFFVDLIPVGDRIEDALKTKKIVDMTALMALAEQAAKKAPTKKEGRRCANDREKQRKTKAKLYPILIEKSLISPIVPKPYSGPQRRDFNPNSACDFHFGEVGHTVENCGQLRHRVQDLIDHGVLKFEGLPNITTNPLPKHPEGGVNMVEVEEGNEESIAWRRLFYTLEKQKHITPLDAPPGPSTGDSCEYHSGARGHSLDCCEEFKKKVTDLMENGIRSIWMNIVEDEMDLDNLQDEEADWGYFMEDDTDEWRDVDFTEFFQFPCLIVPPGFVTPEFEIFYEDGDPEVHLQKYGEKMALHLENELLMISVFPESLSKQAAAWFYQLRNLTGWDDLVRVFLERYRFNPHSILEYLGLKKDEEPYIIPDPGAGEGEEPIKTPPSIITTTAEEEYAGPMVEGLSIHTIALRRRIPPPHHRPATANREKKSRRGLAYHCYSVSRSSNEITRKTSNDPHVSKIDNKTDCSLDNIDNSDEEIELPSDILEALERQDEGSKPNIEELEIVNLANEGEEPREVKIGTRCAAEQKEALIALLREFHEIFAWSYQDMPGLDTDIVVHKIPLEARMQARQSKHCDRMKPEVILKIKEEVEKQLKAGFLSTVTYSDWVANIVPVPKKDGKQRTSYSHSWTDSQGTIRSRWPKEDKSKTAFVTHWGTFVYDVMPFGLKNAGATYQRAMVTLFHDMIHHEIEVYVDDMIAKSRTAQDHLTDLRKLFQRLKKYQLRLNPNKCAFGVTSGKLLGFIVSGRGIEIDPAKTAREAFDKIKEYLLNPPILVPPTPGRPLILYLTVQEASMGCMLGQQDETGKKEQAIYYLSKKFTEPETRYLLVEKTCCALGLGLQEAETVHALLHHLVGIPDGPDQAIKGQAIADYLADYPSEQLELMDSEFPDEDTNGEWQARDPKLIPYQRYISRLVPKFKYVTFTYTPRAHNHFADALATLASLIKLVEGDDVRPLRIETRDIPAYCVCIEECMNVEAEIDDKPWYYDIKRFIQDREYPSRATENEKKYIRRMAFQFFP